ncbi:MAG: hypothetical protein ACUVQR_11770 [Thermogutta sp.]
MTFLARTYGISSVCGWIIFAAWMSSLEVEAGEPWLYPSTSEYRAAVDADKSDATNVPPLPAGVIVPNTTAVKTEPEGEVSLEEGPDIGLEPPDSQSAGAMVRHEKPNISENSSQDKPPQLEEAGADVKLENREEQPGSSAPKPLSKRMTIDPKSVGHPLAAGIAKLVAPEIEAQWEEARIVERFQQFRNYAASRLAATRSDYTSSEINGLARLKWFEHLLLNPLAVPRETEEFTRLLHAGFAAKSRDGFRFALRQARSKMDAPDSVNPILAGSEKAQDEANADPYQRLVNILTEARKAWARSVEPLQPAELNELARRLYYVLTTNTVVGHTVNDRGSALRMVRLMQKMDRAVQWDLAEILVNVCDNNLLESLQTSRPQGTRPGPVNGVSGEILARIETEAGTILVGGPGNNEYRLEDMKDVACLVDLGGNDVYLEGTVSVERPILIIIDLAGDDRYQGKLPGIQGSAIMGGAILVDRGGNDIYWGQDVAQGSTLGGVGILVDMGGNDQYLGYRRVQGQAVGGLGLLIDFGGNDDYRAAMWAQGLGGPLGFGLIDDLEGDDHYYVGGRFYDSYPETPGYDGWGQGVGAGIRGAANGGIGVLLEGAGDDVYEFDYFGQGGGYWLAIGIARDFAGNDQRVGATLNAYDRSSRTQPRFQRFGNGWGCHYAVGALIDDGSDDSYDGSIMGTGFAWDLSVGYLIEMGGKDQYLARVGGVQGQGAQASLGVLYDFEGNDTYRGTSQGYSSSSITYHPYPTCGGNFSFVIDYGGTDEYGSRVRNNAVSRRGMSGFVVDRPKQEELDEMQAAAEAKATPASDGEPQRNQ